MKRLVRSALFILGAIGLGSGAVAEDDGFRPLFNGKDLSNWVDVTVHEDTFSVRDGVIYCTGKPTGVMRTDRHYENFILELEWRHLRPKAWAPYRLLGVHSFICCG